MRNFQDDIAAYVGDATCLPPFHPLANNFPMMDADSLEFKEMVDSVKVKLLEPITMYEGMVLDGRNRARACFAAGVKLQPKDFAEFDHSKMTALEFIFRKNLHRRHLSTGQRAMLADDMVTSKHGGDHESELSRAEAAKLWCVSLWSVESANFIKRCAVPKVTANVRAGRTAIFRGRMLARMTDEEQRAEPDVKFGGRRRKPPKPPTAATAQAWLNMDDNAKLRFRDSVVEPWFREHMARHRSTNGGPDI